MVKRKEPDGDAVRNHPAAVRKLAELIHEGIALPQHHANKWYLDPTCKQVFGPVNKEKFRMSYNYAMEKKYGKDRIRQAI